MADDKTKKDYRDRDRINKNEPYEVEYWSTKWGVTKAQLIACCDTVGPMVKDVQRCLGK